MASTPPPDDIERQTEEFVEAQIESSLAPHRGKYSSEVYEELAEELRVFLHTHPVASRLLARVRPVRVDSGEQPAPGARQDAPRILGKGKVG